MIGLVVVGTDRVAEALLISLQMNTCKQEQVCAVPLSFGEDADEQRAVILKAVASVDTGDGVLVLTDSNMTPAGYLMLSILDKANMSAVSGVNLTMLMKVVEKRSQLSLDELSDFARDEGRKGITRRDA